MKASIRLFTLLLVLALTTGTALAGSNSTNLPGGAALAVSIDNPLTSTEFLLAEGSNTRDVVVSGTASVGEGMPNATMVYVIDVSGSTDAGGGTGCSPILQCEKNFVNNLNGAVITTGSVGNVGTVVFADSAAAADMAGDASDQLLVAPDLDSNVSTVVNSAFSDVGGGNGGVTQYSLREVGQFTNFAAGLQSALVVLGASTDPVKRVVFMSDGLSNRGTLADFNNAVAALAGLGAVVDSVAVGAGSSCTGGDIGTLEAMALGTGGTCTPVPDPGTLPDIIPLLVQPYLDQLALEVDGSVVASPFTTSKPLPLAGADNLAYEVTAPALGPGDHELCVTAYGHDTIGAADVTQCETVHLYAFAVAPATATNELGTPPQTHSVAATLTGPAPLGGRDVIFTITSGPNMQPAATVPTDASGVAGFTYTATQGPSGLGTDVIEACITLADPLGETGCRTATKLWQDTTPPDTFCNPSVNPGGNVPNAPGKGGKGQNQDGFYQLAATDLVWPASGIQMWVTDTGSGQVFGPFPVGTNIKYTQAPDATPFQEPMSGAVAWHIVGKGDARVTATDGSGNTSAGVMCLVPPPPQ